MNSTKVSFSSLTFQNVLDDSFHLLSVVFLYRTSATRWNLYSEFLTLNSPHVPEKTKNGVLLYSISCHFWFESKVRCHIIPLGMLFQQSSTFYCVREIIYFKHLLFSFRLLHVWIHLPVCVCLITLQWTLPLVN